MLYISFFYLHYKTLIKLIHKKGIKLTWTCSVGNKTVTIDANKNIFLNNRTILHLFKNKLVIEQLKSVNVKETNVLQNKYIEMLEPVDVPALLVALTLKYVSSIL